MIARSNRGSFLALLAVVLVGSLTANPPGAAASSAGSGRPVTPLLPPTQAFQQPFLARDPSQPGRLALAYQEGSKLQECYLALSSDNGATWHTTALVGSQGGLALPKGAKHCYNPAVAFGPKGAAYYVFQDSGFRRLEPTALNVFIMRSSDGGTSFGAPQKLDPIASAPNDWYPDVVVDQRTGKVYVAWSRYILSFTAFSGHILVASSTDGARTFSAPVRINPPKAPQNVGAPYLAVGARGRLYLTYLPGPRVVAKKFVPTLDAMQVAVSSDGGVTFKVQSLPTLAKACVGQRNQKCDKLVPAYNIGSIATDGPGRAYLTWWDDNGPGQLPRILFSPSTDGGHTWAAPQTLKVPAGSVGEQFYDPWLSVAPNGRIDLAYYGLTPSGLINVYRTSSSNGGSTFSPPVRLDVVASPAKVGPSAGGRLTASFGDHLAVSSSNTSVLVAWTDSSRGNLTTGHQDIFVASHSFGGGGGGLAVWVYVLIAAGAVIVVALIFGLIRRKGRRSAPAPTPVSA
ncbi:MAG: sialidase family protein [Acidimicrobiales bacterium]